MRRLVYRPQIKAYIKLEQQNQVIDISDDIISGSVNKQLNAMASATLTLQNKFGKYTGGASQAPGVIFQPMDRIIILMSRYGDPQLNFSGYITNATAYQIYPDTVTIECNDTLKTLQYTYFDPGLPFLTQFFQWASDGTLIYDFSSGQITSATGALGNLDEQQGIGKILYLCLTQIAGWNPDAVHIHELPVSFLDTIATVMQAEVAKEVQDLDQLKARLFSLFTAGGIYTGNTPGSANPNSIATVKQTSIIDVMNYAAKAGFTGEDLQLITTIAGMESGFDPSAVSPDKSSYGLWQINENHLPHTLPDGTQITQTSSLFNPSINAQMAFSLYQSNIGTHSLSPDYVNGRDAMGVTDGRFNPWDTYWDPNTYSRVGTQAGKTAWTSYMQQVDNARKDQGALAISQSNPFSNITDSKTTKASRGLISIAIGELGVSDTNNSARVSQYAATTNSPAAAFTPGGSSEWCAAFVYWCLTQIGRGDLLPNTASVSEMVNYAKAHNEWVSIPAKPQVGDLIVYQWSPNPNDNHIGIVVGVASDGSPTVVSGNYGDKVSYDSRADLSSAIGYIRLPLSSSLVGTIPSAYAGTNAGGTTANNQPLTRQQIAGITEATNFFTQQLIGTDSTLSLMLTGEHALANDISLMQWITQLVESSGRVFMAAPDGTFYAFYPDYFGWFERTTYFQISELEIINLQISVNDLNLVTHLYGVGNYFGLQQSSPLDLVYSPIASVTNEAFPFFINIDSTRSTIDPNDPTAKNTDPKYKFDAIKFLERYGARPLQYQLENVRNPVLLWMATWMQFCLLWSQRFSTVAEFTFLPELLPGGLVNIGNRLQMFVQSVTHSWDMESGFTTSAELIAPQTVGNNSDNPSLLNSMVISGTTEPISDRLSTLQTQISQWIAQNG